MAASNRHSDQASSEVSILSRPPAATSAAVTKSMRGNVSSGTKPEVAFRRLLREARYPGYRLNWRKAPGSPDVAYPGRGVAFFCHGCWWHRCPNCNLPSPKSNTAYWTAKFERNLERDARKESELRAAGWSVMTVWECEIRDEPASVVERAVRLLEHRTQVTKQSAAKTP